MGSAIKGAAGAAIAAAVALKGLEKAADGARKVWESVKSDIDSASNLNGQVAVAKAMSDVNMQMAEMRRANELGPQLARIEKARGEIDIKMYELTTEIKAVLVDILVPIIEGISAIAEPTLEAIDYVGGIYYEVNRITNPHLALVIAGIEKIYNFYRKNSNDVDDEDVFFEALEKAVRSVTPPPTPNAPPQDNRQTSAPTNPGFFA